MAAVADARTDFQHVKRCDEQITESYGLVLRTTDHTNYFCECLHFIVEPGISIICILEDSFLKRLSRTVTVRWSLFLNISDACFILRTKYRDFLL